MTFYRETQPCHRGEHARIPGYDNAYPGRINRSACRFHARYPVAVPIDSCHLALLDDVHAPRIRRARESPRNRVVPRNAGAALQGGAEYRVTRIRRGIDEGNRLRDLFGIDYFGIDTVQTVGVDAAFDVAHVLQRMTQVVHAALAEHDVVVEVLAQALPELHGMLVEQ